MALSSTKVSQLAELAHVRLSPDELERLTPEVSAILDTVYEVAQVETNSVVPTTHVVPMVNVFREDASKPSLPVDVALGGAPSVDSGQFAVPRILGEAL